MKNLISTILGGYRGYRLFVKRSRAYKAINYSLAGIGTVYCLLLIFPSLLFAHQYSYKNIQIYARQPFDPNLERVLDLAETRLLRSPIYDRHAARTMILADSFGLYKFLTLSRSSMGSTIPVLGYSRINRADVEMDLVFREGDAPNSRSLSGVIAHEVMHNQIREYLGLKRYLATPAWRTRVIAKTLRVKRP